MVAAVDSGRDGDDGEEEDDVVVREDAAEKAGCSSADGAVAAVE